LFAALEGIYIAFMRRGAEVEGLKQLRKKSLHY